MRGAESSATENGRGEGKSGVTEDAGIEKTKSVETKMERSRRRRRRTRRRRMEGALAGGDRQRHAYISQYATQINSTMPVCWFPLKLFIKKHKIVELVIFKHIN